MSAQFLIGVFVPTESLADPLRQLLAQQSFVVSWSRSTADFTDWVISNRHRIDCLIVQSSEEAFQALRELKQRDILLPALTVDYLLHALSRKTGMGQRLLRRSPRP